VREPERPHGGISCRHPDFNRRSYCLFGTGGKQRTKDIGVSASLWKGTAEKKPSEKWVNINLDPMAVGSNRVTTEEVQTLADSLEKAGYTPLFRFLRNGGRGNRFRMSGKWE
jgi:hypothetical protein